MDPMNETYTGNLAAVTILRRLGHEPTRLIDRGGRILAVYPGTVHDILEGVLGELAETRTMFVLAGAGPMQGKAGAR